MDKDQKLEDMLFNSIEKFTYNKRYISDIVIDDTLDPIDPTVGPTHDDRDFVSRNLGITFEKIKQNIMTYPTRTILTNPLLLEKTYYLENNKKILLVIDMSVKGRVTTTMSGDTTFDTPIKRIKVFDKEKIDTVYQKGE